MSSLYRKVLTVLPRVGVQVVNLGSGASVLARRGEYSARKLRPRTWLVEKAGGDEPSAAPSIVDIGETGSFLLLNPAHTDEQEFQLAAANYLGSHHVAGLLARYDVNCVFDVGANVGQYGQRLRELGYSGRIISFEPTSRALARLQVAAQDDPNWWVMPFALGREAKVESMFVDWSSMNSLLEPTEYGRGRYKRFKKASTEEIEIRRLVDVMTEAMEGLTNPRPFLKMDTQGFDLEVFAGAGDRIAEFIGLQSEVAVLALYEGSPLMRESLDVYEAAGFGITGMYPVTREASGRVVEFDCVMVRPDKLPG